MAPNKRQRANRRAREERAVKTEIPADADEKERKPIPSLDNLYEISLDGDVYSVRESRFIKHTYYRGSTYIEVQIEGEKHQRNIRDAIEEAWAGVLAIHEVTLKVTTYVAAPTARAAQKDAQAHRATIYESDGRSPDIEVSGSWSSASEYLDAVGPDADHTVLTSAGSTASALDVLPDPDGVFSGEGETYKGECSFCTAPSTHLAIATGLCRGCRVSRSYLLSGSSDSGSA